MDDEIGYGKPPTRTKFKPGRSGNPRGRPKGSGSLLADIEKELEVTCTVREGDAKLTITKRAYLAKVLVGKAGEGDMRAIEFVMKLILAKEQTNSPADHEEGDSEVMRQFIEREVSRRVRALTPPVEEEVKSNTKKTNEEEA
jgi:hypothetical protein